MSARRYEKDKAKKHRGKHVGGPGKPDYERGEIEGEVKKWKRPMSKSEVMKEARKGRKELIAKSGFSEGAIKYAERYRPDLKLIHGNKVVKPRKKRH